MSEDPIGFEGGDMNLYRHIDNSVVLYTDSFGLWKIKRDSAKTIAEAYAEQDDTFEGLALEIGLDISQKEDWLTLYDNEQHGTKPKCGNKYGIPNVMLSIFIDANYRFKQWDKTYNVNLKDLGFFVSKFNNERFSMGNATDGNPESINTKDVIILLFSEWWSKKSLHGVLIRAHGNNTLFGRGHDYFYDALGNPRTIDPNARFPYYKGPPTKVNYSEVLAKKKYNLAAVVPISCYPDNANTNALGNLLWGHGIKRETHQSEHPSEIKSLWGGGKQGTKQ
jgi:hypothetical protein